MNKTELKIFEMLTSKATSQDKDGHFCIYPVKELAMDCNINSRTVMRALKELEQGSYVSRKRQGNGQEQKIYLLNVTSAERGENCTSENVTSAERGENCTSENVTSAECGENCTSENVTSAERGENCTSENVTSAERGENVPSTRCGEIEKLFLMIRQGFGLSAFTLQATSKKVEPNVDPFTGKAVFEFKDIKVLIDEYSKNPKNLTVPTMQLLDFLDIRLTERGMKSPHVEFTIDEYMQYRKLYDRQSAREQIKSSISDLKSISLEWEEKRAKG